MTLQMRIGRFESAMRFRFRHASADRVDTENIIVQLRHANGLCGFGEGCPRDYVTGETFDTAKAFLAKYGSDIADAALNLNELRQWVETRRALIDGNPAAFCAIELAALDLIGRRQANPLEAVLKLPKLPETIPYTAVLGDSGPGKTRVLATAYQLWGFSDFKVKLSGDLARDQRRVASIPIGARIRVDANNFWCDPDDCIRHMEQLGRDIWAIEEPVSPGNTDAMRAVSQALNMRIILDESLTRTAQLASYEADPERWIVNIRISKCGGVLRAIDTARAAQACGVDVILGAHVGETSLLTRAALAAGQAFARPPIAREGAYGKILLKHDICVPSLRFNYGGSLRTALHPTLSNPGLGPTVRASSVSWEPAGDEDVRL